MISENFTEILPNEKNEKVLPQEDLNQSVFTNDDQSEQASGVV